jgi:hypothetical protein
MYKPNLILLAAFTFVAVFSSHCIAQDTDEEQIRNAVGYYFKAHATGNGEYLREAFHPVANLYFVRDDELAQITLEDYIAMFGGTPPDDEDQRVRTIDEIDFSGNAAIATITLDYPNAVYTDYMSMLKIEGEWKIVNKTFFMSPQ